MNRDIYHTIRSLLIFFLGCTTFLLLTKPSLAQENQDKLQLGFIKNSDTISASGLYFNVLRIVNNTSKFAGGEITFSAPENWNIITSQQNQAGLNPGDTVYIPVRVSAAPNSIGGISYIISASLKTKDEYLVENTFVTVPSRIKWDFSTNKSSIYFNQYSPFTNFQVNLSNKGNTNELIKIHLKIGRLLMLANNSDNDFTEYITLPAFKDTTINYSITYPLKLSYDEKVRYESSWKESAIIATASTELTEKSVSVSIRKLNSTFLNHRAENSTPLNFDYQVYNLMSNQKARSNIKIYGNVLLKGNRDIRYNIGLQNVYYGKGSNRSFDYNHQLLYSVIYADQKNKIQLGYNISGGDLHAINGRGITGSYDINKQNKLSYTFIQNPYSLSLGESVGFKTSFNKIQFNTGVTNESTNTGYYSATSVLMGVGFNLLKYHSIFIQTLGSASRYDLFGGRDTSVLGLSYRFAYSVKYKKFDLKLNTLNSAHNYIRSSGRQQIYLNGNYIINNSTRLILYANRQNYSSTGYPNSFFNPSNQYINDYFRLTASLSKGKIIYSLGPSYTGSLRQFSNPVTHIKTEYKTLQPGIYGSVSFKLNGYRSITPNLTISNLKYSFTSDDNNFAGISQKNNLFYSAGVNYFDNAWKVNAYYSSGSTTDLYRSLQIDEKPVLSRSIQLRPSYEKFLFERKVKLSAYMNYAYFMPSGRENVSYNLKYDHYLNNGWTFYISGYIYSNTRVDTDLGRINSKDLNFIAGVVKSFEIQQPRLKYYDFRLVFFNDLDGNQIKSKNEPPVPNIMVNLEKEKGISSIPTNMTQTDLVSDVNGEIYYQNLPKDNYKLSFSPLVNLESLYFINGSTQGYFNDHDRTVYIPLAESYKIKGRIILVRDPNSSEGKISLDGIRVSATGPSGENYSALTDNFGAYILNVPKGERFKVKINNIFGENFILNNDEMNVQFTANKTINLDFIITEKKREVNFNNGNEIYQFKSIGN